MVSSSSDFTFNSSMLDKTLIILYFQRHQCAYMSILNSILSSIRRGNYHIDKPFSIHVHINMFTYAYYYTVYSYSGMQIFSTTWYNASLPTIL